MLLFFRSRAPDSRYTLISIPALLCNYVLVNKVTVGKGFHQFRYTFFYPLFSIVVYPDLNSIRTIQGQGTLPIPQPKSNFQILRCTKAKQTLIIFIVGHMSAKSLKFFIQRKTANSFLGHLADLATSANSRLVLSISAFRKF